MKAKVEYSVLQRMPVDLLGKPSYMWRVRVHSMHSFDEAKEVLEKIKQEETLSDEELKVGKFAFHPGSVGFGMPF